MFILEIYFALEHFVFDLKSYKNFIGIKKNCKQALTQSTETSNENSQHFTPYTISTD